MSNLEIALLIVVTLFMIWSLRGAFTENDQIKQKLLFVVVGFSFFIWFVFFTEPVEIVYHNPVPVPENARYK